MVQLSHLYMTTGKTKALTRLTFVGKVTLFNTLSQFVTVFLPRSKNLLISWLQSLFAVILELKKIKSVLEEQGRVSKYRLSMDFQSIKKPETQISDHSDWAAQGLSCLCLW